MLRFLSNNNSDHYELSPENSPLLITSKEVYDSFSYTAHNPGDIQRYAKQHHIPKSNIIVTSFKSINKLLNIPYNGEIQLFFHGGISNKDNLVRLWVYNYTHEQEVCPIEFYKLLGKTGIFENKIRITKITFDACYSACPVEIKGKIYASFAERFYRFFMLQQYAKYSSNPPTIKAADGESFLDFENENKPGKRSVKPGVRKQLGEWRYLNHPLKSNLRRYTMKTHSPLNKLGDLDNHQISDIPNIGRIPHDGHCLFRAITFLYKNKIDDTAVLKLRTKIKNLATNDPSIRRRFYSNTASLARLNSLTQMNNNIVWGGDEELHLISCYLGRSIYLYHMEECVVYVFNGLELQIKDWDSGTNSNALIIYYRDSHFDVEKF